MMSPAAEAEERNRKPVGVHRSTAPDAGCENEARLSRPASTPPVPLRHRQLARENLALRHELAVYKRTATRPRLRRTDRLFFSEAVCQEHCSRLISPPSISAPS